MPKIFLPKLVFFVLSGLIILLHLNADLVLGNQSSSNSEHNENFQEMNENNAILEVQNSALAKELDMARQIIGELNIKLANKENDLESLNKANSLSNNTTDNMNIEELLLVSIEECSKQLKILKSTLEECKEVKDNCEAEKSIIKMDSELLIINNELLINEKEHCLIEVKRDNLEMAKLQNHCTLLSKSNSPLQSCEVMECLESMSTYDILSALFLRYQTLFLNDLVPYTIQKITFVQVSMSSSVSYFVEFIYPELNILFKSTVSKVLYLSNEAISWCSSFWSTKVVPLYSFTFRPNAIRLYTVYLEPFITQQLVPLYKDNMEPGVDTIVSYITDIYSRYLSFLVDDYLYPSYELFSNKVNYVIYFSVKYLEQDDLVDVTMHHIINLWELGVHAVSSLPIVDQIVGPSNSILFGRVVLMSICCLIIILLRNLFLAIAAGLVMILLSPLLAVVYVSAKVVSFLFPAKVVVSTDKGAHTRTSSQKDSKVVARRSGSKAAVVRSTSNDSPSVNVNKQSHGAGTLPPRRPTVTRVAATTNSANVASSTRVVTSSPITRSRTTSTGGSVEPFSPSPWASPPSSAGHAYNSNLINSPSAVEQLRNRKFPGIVTRGITPAAALGLVPAVKERSPFDNPMFKDDDDEENEKLDESVVANSQEKDFSYADL